MEKPIKIYEIPTTVRVRGIIRVEGTSFREAISGRLPKDWNKEVVIEELEYGEVEIVDSIEPIPTPNGVNAKIRVYDRTSGEQLYDNQVFPFVKLQQQEGEWPSDK